MIRVLKPVLIFVNIPEHFAALMFVICAYSIYGYVPTTASAIVWLVMIMQL